MEGAMLSRLSSCLSFFVCTIIAFKLTAAYNAVAQIGQTVQVKCIYDYSLGELTDIVWFHNGNKLMKHHSSIEVNTGRYQPVLPLEKSSATLKIRDTVLEDAGMYTCEQYFKTGKSAIHHTTLQVQSLPIIQMERNVSIENRPVFAMCFVKFALEPEFTTITWSIGDENVSFNSSFALKGHYEDSTLYSYGSNVTLYGNRSHDGKLLKCSVFGELNSSTSVPLTILYSPTVSLESVQPAGVVIFVDPHDSINISCISEGNPSPRIHLERKISFQLWKKLQVKPLIIEHVRKSIFTITISTKDDTGTFRCVGDNKIGQEISKTYVNIEMKRSVTVKIFTPRPENTFFRDTFHISCVAHGNPDPQVHLEKIVKRDQWIQLQVEPRMTHQNSSFNFTFSITNAQNNASGVYRCRASNKIGSNATSANVTIKTSGISHRYNVTTTSTRNVRVGNIEVTRSNFKNPPDVCRSIPPLPRLREPKSLSKGGLDNSTYDELRQDNVPTSDREGAAAINEHKCEVKYYVLEGP